MDLWSRLEGRFPRIRFLIVDDQGAEKTIVASFIIKEMKIRNQAGRILIVAPGHKVRPHHCRRGPQDERLTLR